MEAFVAGEDKVQQCGEDGYRVSNLLAIKALDHALKVGCNRNLAQNINPCPLRHFGPQEERYGVNIEDLPPEYHREGAVRRSCI